MSNTIMVIPFKFQCKGQFFHKSTFIVQLISDDTGMHLSSEVEAASVLSHFTKSLSNSIEKVLNPGFYETRIDEH